eukprot:gnl/MRDRNA2_/MRDRNA2_77743_c0_seq1.p1 gnl/MRDRNA2_/MRDRNA2_77743_c0~~gnl/MRDRNA2_/MRDRNA2_77743_c0_seq1.p1  ORF type:complete len:121 (-),score=8.63 gnl/MRDRNA2_/MRDRNA2_77743_c0_seq1:59-400(-)
MEASMIELTTELHSWSSQKVSNAAWGLPKGMCFKIWPTGSTQFSVSARFLDFVGNQDVTTLAQYLATVELCREIVIDVLDEWIVDSIMCFQPLGIMNMVWAYSTLTIKNLPLR